MFGCARRGPLPSLSTAPTLYLTPPHNRQPNTQPNDPSLPLPLTPPPQPPTNHNNNSGFGFVVYENQRDAEEAISRMDNAELDGRTLRVNFARPK